MRKPISKTQTNTTGALKTVTRKVNMTRKLRTQTTLRIKQVTVMICKDQVFKISRIWSTAPCSHRATFRQDLRGSFQSSKTTSTLYWGGITKFYLRKDQTTFARLSKSALKTSTRTYSRHLGTCAEDSQGHILFCKFSSRKLSRLSISWQSSWRIVLWKSLVSGRRFKFPYQALSSSNSSSNVSSKPAQFWSGIQREVRVPTPSFWLPKRAKLVMIHINSLPNKSRRNSCHRFSNSLLFWLQSLFWSASTNMLYSWTNSAHSTSW